MNSSSPADPPRSPHPGVALARVLQVMRPLVRLLVRNGVTYPALAAGLKRVFVDAAREELAVGGRSASDSALTLLSGVHRKDVRELMRGDAANDPAAPAPSIAAEVVARWMSDADWLDARGRALPLPRGSADEAGSFDALVAAVTRDVRPRAVLEELLRLGVAELISGNTGNTGDIGIDQVALRRSGFVPRRDFAEMASALAVNLQDHASAAVANLDEGRNFLDQAVYVDEIGEASAGVIQQAAVKAWRTAMKQVLRVAQERFDHDARALPLAQRRHRARLGVYFFSTGSEGKPT